MGKGVMTLVREAARQGRVDDVIRALEELPGTDPQAMLRLVCHDYHTVRKHEGHVRLAEHLLSHGARPELGLVFEVARGGQAELLAVLLDAGQPRDIFVAAVLGDSAEVERLLSADPTAAHATDFQRMTPLHYVCASALWKRRPGSEAGYLAACSALLAAGAGVEAGAAYYGLGWVTPLLCCAWTGGHLGIAELLLEQGAALTPAVFYAAMGHLQRHGDGHYELAELCLRHRFDINHNEGRTPLHAFAAHGDAKGVTWLLEHGADVNALDAEGNTPLHMAAARNSGTKVLRVLVDHGAQVAARNAEGETALDRARGGGRKGRGAEWLAGIGE